MNAAPGMTEGGRRLLVALLFVAIALNYVDRQVLALLKPTLEAEFGWSSSDYAHLGSAFQIAAASALLFVGWFVDRVGVRLALGLGVVLWSLAGMAHAFAGTVQQFVVARVSLAVAETVGTPAAVKTAAVYLPLKQRSFALGLFNTAPNIGAILTPLLVPPLALAFGWKAAFLFTGGLGLVWVVFWIFGTRNMKPVEAVTAATPKAASWASLLRARSSWTIIGAKAFTDLVWWFVLYWIPDFFHHEFGLEQGALGYPVVLVFTLAALGALSSGVLFPRLIDRGLSIDAARKRSMLFYALLILPLPLALVTTNAWVAAAIIGVGLFAHQGFSTNIFGLSTDIVPSSGIARVIAMGAVAGNLSGGLIIELTGWSIENGHGYWPMFAICAAAYLVALGFIQLMLPVIRQTNA